MTLDDHRILRIEEVVQITSLSRSSLYQAIADGQFPPPVRVGAQRVGWRQAEIIEWIASRPPAE